MQKDILIIMPSNSLRIRSVELADSASTSPCGRQHGGCGLSLAHLRCRGGGCGGSGWGFHGDLG